MQEKPLVTQLPLFTALEGESVIVRPYAESDAHALFEAVQESRDHLRPWMPWADQHQSLEETLDWIIHQHAAWLVRETLSCAVVEKASGRFAGGAGLAPRDWQVRSFEIGYWLRSSATGRGYMTEATRLLTVFAFETLQARRIMIRCDERNRRSAAIPRRLGYLLEGALRNDSLAPDGTLRTTLVFALTPEDWQRLRQGMAGS